MKRCLSSFILLLACISVGYAAIAPDAVERDTLFRIVAYNVENLFHPDVDSINSDTSFTPDGKYHWTYSKYRRKVQNIAQVLTTIGQFNGIDIVGLCEVENEQCVSDVCTLLRRFNYRYIHFDSPDRRGIDVALLYRPTFRILSAYPIPILLPDSATTRDILCVSGVYNTSDTLCLFLCHLPSQLGGVASSNRKRDAAYQVLQHHIDSVLTCSPATQIVVMGDMNAAPQDNLHRMHNAMLPLEKTARKAPFLSDIPRGTHKYNGVWTFIDQFYLSDNLQPISDVSVYSAPYLLEEDERYLGFKPKRTYIGFRYQVGYSDHLPILLTLRCR